MSVEAVASTQARPGAPRRLPFDARYLAPALVTCVLVVGQISFGFLESWSRTFLARRSSSARSGRRTSAVWSSRISVNCRHRGRWPSACNWPPRG